LGLESAPRAGGEGEATALQTDDGVELAEDIGVVPDAALEVAGGDERVYSSDRDDRGRRRLGPESGMRSQAGAQEKEAKEPHDELHEL
jgi:hypothetical protein